MQILKYCIQHANSLKRENMKHLPIIYMILTVIFGLFSAFASYYDKLNLSLIFILVGCMFWIAAGMLIYIDGRILTLKKNY